MFLFVFLIIILFFLIIMILWLWIFLYLFVICNIVSVFDVIILKFLLIFNNNGDLFLVI